MPDAPADPTRRQCLSDAALAGGVLAMANGLNPMAAARMSYQHLATKVLG